MLPDLLVSQEKSKICNFARNFCIKKNMVRAETKHSLYGPCLLLNSTGRACSLRVSQGGRADSVKRTALALGGR